MMHFPQDRHSRADAARNRDAIIDATLTTLKERPRASMGEIAAAAGVSRSTLYSHFPNRQALVVTTLKRVLSQANARLAGLDPALSPEDAVGALVATSWKFIAHFESMSTASEGAVSPGELRRLHDEPAVQIRRLLVRGRDAGSFRVDQNLDWQVECVYAIVRAGSSLVNSMGPELADPTEDMVTTIRAVLAAVPARSGTEIPESHPRQACQP